MSVEAVDKLDPYKRVTPTNRELLAQGAGNIACGLLGGLPVTAVIVRSSANVSAGGRTRLVAIAHGVLLMLAVLAAPKILNLVPLSALAAVLIAVGYKLTKPAIFMQKFEKGKRQFIPFVVTVAAILLTDLLTGVLIGVGIGMFFVVLRNFRPSLMTVADGDNILVRCRDDLFFIHKNELRRTLDNLPDDTKVLIDLSRATFIDLDNVEIIRDFIEAAPHRGITVTVKNNGETNNHKDIKELTHAAA